MGPIMPPAPVMMTFFLIDMIPSCLCRVLRREGGESICCPGRRARISLRLRVVYLYEPVWRSDIASGRSITRGWLPLASQLSETMQHHHGRGLSSQRASRRDHGEARLEATPAPHMIGAEMAPPLCLHPTLSAIYGRSLPSELYLCCTISRAIWPWYGFWSRAVARVPSRDCTGI